MTRILLRSMIFATIASTGWQVVISQAAAQEPTLADPFADDDDAAADDDAAEEEPRQLDAAVAPYYHQAHRVAPWHAAPLFQNYYAQPGIPAGMYPAPHPTPPMVGHVYYTYQPFMPHEHLYTHHREYYHYHGHYHGYGDCHGHPSVNRTTVRWSRGNLMPVYHLLGVGRVPHIPCGVEPRRGSGSIGGLGIGGVRGCGVPGCNTCGAARLGRAGNCSSCTEQQQED